MNYCEIKTTDIANGPGVRVSLFVSGCRHHCKGCFNPETWDFAYGKAFNEAAWATVLEALRPGYIEGVTLLGGDPMEPENATALLPFLQRLKAQMPEKSIWCFTGDLYENLLQREETAALLQYVDVLVDGPFVEAQKNITLRFRGSENQRLIDIQRSKAAGVAVLWQDPKEVRL